MNVSVKDLLDAGVHFGHQVRRWNPKSKPFVYDNRHGISIIDLEKTYDLLEKAAQAVEEVVGSGKQVLIVGTKRQAIEPVRELAAATNMPFCVNRWMGGTLTNYETVSTSIAKYKKYLRMEEDGTLDKMHGKESASIKRQMTRMNRDFEGLLNLQGLPGALFIIDSFNESIAVAEANRLKIPVIALVDSNSDPSFFLTLFLAMMTLPNPFELLWMSFLTLFKLGQLNALKPQQNVRILHLLLKNLTFLIMKTSQKSPFPKVTTKWTLTTVKRQKMLKKLSKKNLQLRQLR